MFVLNQLPGPKKLAQDTLDSLPDGSPEDSPLTKREKGTTEAGVYRGHRSPGFWNRLSKVHLTRGALREFDRRTLKAEQLVLKPHSSIHSKSGPGTKSVKRFVRHGGPDLTHIRGFAILPNHNDTMSPLDSSRKRSSKFGGSGLSRRIKSNLRSQFRAEVD